MTRRQVLGAGAGGLAALAMLGLPGGARADTRTIPFGAAIHDESFWTDPALRAAVAEHCDQVTLESAMKMDMVLPAPGRYDFSTADTLAGWAIQHGLGVHGHPLIWYYALPEWVQALTSPREVEALFSSHIDTMIAQYRHVVRAWDVVNEAIPDYPDTPDTLRESLWLAHLGPDYVAQAFRRARAADPGALLVLNEYDIEFAVENGPAKREAFRRLVLRLLDADAPIDAIGFQAHLHGGWAIASHEVAALVAEMRGYGLEVLVTELDVLDTAMVADFATRDRLIAEQVDTFLSAVGADAPPRSITTWGLSDKHSWVRWLRPRPDGVQSRSLPLDWDFAPKPFMSVLDRHLGASP